MLFILKKGLGILMIENKYNIVYKEKSISNRARCIRGIYFVLILMTLIFFIMLFKGYIDGEFRSIESLQAYISKFGSFGIIFLTLFQAVQVVIPILPGFLGCAVGTVLFGPVIGFCCNYIGISAGSIIAFLLARKYGLSLLEDIFSKEKYSKWTNWASKSKSYTIFLFLAMILPLFPDDYLCYLTGLSKMTARRFIWIIVLGKPWCILAYSLGFSLI